MSARHIRRNRRYWDRTSDEYQREHASQLNRWDRPGWGVWGIPESRLHVLEDVAGRDVLELGCGGGQWSISLARLGARPVGLDLSRRQLEHAGRLMTDGGVRFPLVNASAEEIPFRDGSFDVVFCDHGGMTFADPCRTVPEAARILRKGGLLAFNIASVFHFLCWDDETDVVDDRLHHDYFGLRKWDDGDTIDFLVWPRLVRRSRRR